MNRPTSITVISWILIVIGGLNLVTTTLNMNNPEVRALMEKSLLPVSVQIAMIYVGMGILVICGAAMLNGQNWARWLYVIWNLIGIGVSLATSPMKLLLVPGILVFILITFFLFRPNATLYFTGGGAADEPAV